MNILIIGEKCFDIFNFGPIRLSPEAPSLVINPTKKMENLGMAANVAANLISLISLNIYSNIECIHQDTDIYKIRYCDETSGNILLRVDSGDKVNRIKLLDKINFNKYDVVVVSDYNKNFLLEEDLAYIGKNSKLSFIDTKQQLGEWAKYYSFIKINKKEFDYQNNKQFIKDLNLIVTLGKDGCLIYPSNKVIKYKESEIKNQAGLGDVFLAGFITEYLNTNDVEKSCLFANKASYIASSKRGVTTVTRKDIELLTF